MRISRLMLTALVLSIAVAAASAQAPAGGQRGGGERGGGGQRGGGGGQPAAPPMRLMSQSFIDGGLIPLRFSAAGEQLSPQLAWVNAPPATQSFVLHMHDMEAARNRTSEDQLHWLVWNIPGTSTGLPEGVPNGPDLKDGSHQTSATGNGIYRAPGAPATGPYHHYVYEIFALDTKLDVAANASDPFDTRAKVLAAMQGHIVGKAVYLGLFRRPE